MDYRFGNVTSKKMKNLIDDLENIGFVCFADKKGEFYCTKGEVFDLNLKLKYNDADNKLTIKTDSGSVSLKLGD